MFSRRKMLFLIGSRTGTARALPTTRRLLSVAFFLEKNAFFVSRTGTASSADDSCTGTVLLLLLGDDWRLHCTHSAGLGQTVFSHWRRDCAHSRNERMCCCCPPAITALFCLWVQSGFSKGSVAGALTFFPPEPPLYHFERRGENGEILNEDDDVDESDEEESGDEEKEVNDEDETSEEKETSKEKETNDTEDPDDGELLIPTGTSPAGPLEQTRAAATADKKKKKKVKSPAAQLTERAKMLRSRSKVRNARDRKDAENGVQYALVLDSRLRCPPSYGAPIDVLKLPSKDGTYLATVVYRVPADHVTPDTKTIIYSHGNATDLGAMYALQAMLVQSLLCHVISYDYSGYGESGGVAMEANTYKDIATVYDYALKNVAGEGNAHNIVLYGQSVGSGPSCHLCSKNKDIGGLILHSPFTSGMRVLTPSR